MPTIADIATTSDDFNILANAIGFVDSQLPDAQLAATLAAPDADLTVFAPTDVAFVSLATDLGYAGDTDDEGEVTAFLAALGPELLRDVILYHVAPGAQTLDELNIGGPVTTAFGGLQITPEGPVLNDLEPDLINASVVTPDVAASNGTIQVIDKVLLPIDLPGNDAPSLTGIVAASGGTFDDNAGDFDLLLNAVIAADLAETLDSDAVDFTVFAPNDAAFVGLAKTLGFTGEGEGDAFGYIVDALSLLGGGDPIPLLTDILTYHVAPTSLQASQVLSGDPIPTVQGGTLTVDGLDLVDADPGIANPTLIATDIQASNGIAHVIDGVLLPVEASAILGARNTDFIIDGDDGNVFNTGKGRDFVDGNGGDDFLSLKNGADVGFGGEGNDTVFAGNGADTIDGGAGNDILHGGRGRDVFIFNEGNEVDRIFDFQNNRDQIDVSGLGITEFSQLEHLISGNRHKTEIDFGDGDELVLIGFNVRRLDESDFIYADPGDAIA